MAICNLKNSHDYYQYAGVKADLSSGKIISWPMSKAEDIYFAVVEYVEEELTTVETVDNREYGITMKMIDSVVTR